jgi:predicted O-methyltransferase YrrM
MGAILLCYVPFAQGVLGAMEGAMIDISSCLDIPGWMSELELTWLAEQASKAERIIEVGSWCGRSTRALALHTPGTVWAVDAWTSMLGGYADNQTKREAEDAYAKFIDNLGEFVFSTKHPAKVNVMRINSLTTAGMLAIRYGNHYFDMVFLDGDHSYEQVSAEIIHYKPLIKPGGMLCGHDLGHGGVNQAVRELVPEYQAVEGTQLWWTVKNA